VGECLICGSELSQDIEYRDIHDAIYGSKISYSHSRNSFYTCPLCGFVIIEYGAVVTLERMRESSTYRKGINDHLMKMLFYNLRTKYANHKNKEWPTIIVYDKKDFQKTKRTVIDLMSITEQEPLISSQQLDMIMELLRTRNFNFGEQFQLEYKRRNDYLHPYFLLSSSSEEAMTMMAHLIELGYMKQVDFRNNIKYYAPTMAYWKDSNSRKAFIAMKFKTNTGGDRSDCVTAIKNACRACGFEAQLVTEHPYNGGIVDEIIADIKRSRFVIADVTYANNGAYWEAGYAQGLGRPVIYCIDQNWVNDEGGMEKASHFDVKHLNILTWNDAQQLEKDLKNRIRATIDGAIMED
jgi:hypothetical protein